MNQLDRLERRLNKAAKKKEAERIKAQKIKAEGLYRIAKLFYSCGDLSELNARKIEKEL